MSASVTNTSTLTTDTGLVDVASLRAWVDLLDPVGQVLIGHTQHDRGSRSSYRLSGSLAPPPERQPVIGEQWFIITPDDAYWATVEAQAPKEAGSDRWIVRRAGETCDVHRSQMTPPAAKV